MITSAASNCRCADTNTAAIKNVWLVLKAIAYRIVIDVLILDIIVYELRKFYESKFREEQKPSILPPENLCRRFSIGEIQSATNGFDDRLLVGQGGFGPVFKGILDNGATTVAVKRLSPKSNQGAPEFWNEIEMLSRFRHSNVVSLVGYCCDCYEMILVYEYSLLGSLHDHLHKMVKNGNPSLSWVKRLEICIGAARGLDYLHTGTGVTRGVIHRDVKSSNIVLDENWAAKISDFGLSKVGPANHSFSYVSTDVKGTFGYLDPEYFVTGKLTTRSDVYSFGVVLLEVLSGRPAVDMSLDEEQWGLARWSQRCIRKGVLDRIIDPSLKGKIMPDCLMEFARIAEQCLHNHPKKRPKMTEVVARLEFALAMQENVNFSGEVIFAGWPHYNQEKADSSREDEIANACNGEYHNEQINGISDSRGAYEHEKNEDHSTGHRILSVNSDGHHDKQIDGISDYTSAFDSEENSYNSFTPQKLSSACNSEKYDEQIDRISNHSWAGGNVKKTDFVAGRIKDKQIDINQDNRDLNMEQEAVNVAPSLQTPAISRLGDASGGQLHIELSKMRSLWQFINEYKRQRTNNVPKGCDAKPSRNCTDDSLFLSGNGMAPYLKEFTLAELKMATRNFKLEEKLGDGGFGKVFKGWVDCMTYAPSKASIGMAVAVRYLCGFHISKEVESEAKFFGKFNHPNLAKLLGYCFKDRNFYLVYEYMPNRSLESCLFRRNLTLPWDARIKIVAGVARVLAFLHTTEEHIIHRDIKASNILLDAEFNAKLSDFGLLPKLDPANGQSHVTMRMPGSYSYAAPKCLAAGQLTKKSDVYAFGVLLLEVLMGLRVIDINRPPGKHNVVNLLRPFLDRGELVKSSRVMPTWKEKQEKKNGNEKTRTTFTIGTTFSDLTTIFRPTRMDTCTTTVFFAAIHAFIFLHYCPTSALAGNFAGDGNTVSDTDLRGIVNALVSGLIVAIVALNIVVFALKQVFGEREKPPSSSSSSYERLCRPFSIAEINSATKNFDTGLVIGRGRFGNVYKGTIAEKAVAIKLWDSASKQAAREFRTEVQMFALHGFRHSHVASLVGYCEHYSNLILVYEFMPLGTLAHNIHKVSDSADCSDISTRLSWVERVKICIGAARGLDYLHTGTSFEHRVMHRHVKSSNILLDMSRTAKVFDFGLSKIGPANQSCALVSTKIKGTFGYLDPEYLVTARLTVKSDVYAFGVVLFEVLTGRPAVDSRLDEEERSLARWAKQCVKRGTIGQIVDPVLREDRICLESLEEFVRIADQCLHKHSSKRPIMAEVVVSLESALRLQEGTCSPLVEVITNAGNRGASNNQNILDSSLQEEVVNACNGGHNNEQIDRTSNGGGIYNNQQDGDLRTGHEGANGNVACHEEDTNGAYNNQQSRDFITEQEVIGGNVGHHDKRINGNSDTDHANNIQEHADSSAEQVAANTVNGGHDLQTDGTIRLGDASGKQSRKKPAMKTLTKFFSDRAGMISGNPKDFIICHSFSPSLH
ncbi:hypothetical protein RJ640_026780 [Escallonia rubra]|uniref:Protein kinase domain-containing protein n=1 Tax=Escallonia rubra TaxID=112253 RepID=A0AA88RTA6_9ASTE|nr:hypothetical protein RJ640_026780 [Escallonia rubra]